MLNFFYIARNTLKECVREPLFFVLLFTSLVLIGMFPSLSMFVFRQQIKLVIDSAMATTMFFGLIAAVLSSGNTVSREMKNGTVLLLMSKPVRRWNFILAKICGILLSLTFFVLICNCATLLAVRIAKDQFELDYTVFVVYYAIIFTVAIFSAVRNYFFHAHFPSSCLYSLLFLFPFAVAVFNFVKIKGADPIRWDIVPALILIFFAVWIMGTITILLATRLETVANLTASFVIFSLGLISNYLFLGEPGEKISFIKKALYAIIPNWQFFWMADALASNQKIPLSYILWAGIYAFLYITICSIIAISMFNDREVANSLK